MDMIDRLNSAMARIEETLEESVDWNAAAKTACLDAAGFKRLFCYMTGMTPAEYVRRRRLTRAADDLRAGESVIDTAMKYGWSSADAFSRAFRRWHGLAPDPWRKSGAAAIVCPPVSFALTVKGGKSMTMALANLPETTICGLSAPFDETLYPTREALRHALWADTCMDVPGRICGAWNQNGSSAMDGVWYGLWRGGRYLIAREEDRLRPDVGEPIERQILPAGLFAVFATERGARAWEALPALLHQILDCWLPSSGYERRGEDILERLHLWTDRERRNAERYYEICLPVRRRGE